MGHAFRGHVHRTSSDHDGEVTIVIKAPRQYHDEVMAIGNLTNQMLYFTAHTEGDLGPQEPPTDTGGDHVDDTD